MRCYALQQYIRSNRLKGKSLETSSAGLRRCRHVRMGKKLLYLIQFFSWSLNKETNCRVFWNSGLCDFGREDISVRFVERVAMGQCRMREAASWSNRDCSFSFRNFNYQLSIFETQMSMDRRTFLSFRCGRSFNLFLHHRGNIRMLELDDMINGRILSHE